LEAIAEEVAKGVEELVCSHWDHNIGSHLNSCRHDSIRVADVETTVAVVTEELTPLFVVAILEVETSATKSEEVAFIIDV